MHSHVTKSRRRLKRSGCFELCFAGGPTSMRADLRAAEPGGPVIDPLVRMNGYADFVPRRIRHNR